MLIKKGDQVIIIKGKDRGKTGKVEKVIRPRNLLIISGLGKGKKHLKPTQSNPHGGIVDFNAPISRSNVMIICPRCSKITRISAKLTPKLKLRVCKKCNESIDIKI